MREKSDGQVGGQRGAGRKGVGEETRRNVKRKGKEEEEFQGVTVEGCRKGRRESVLKKKEQQCSKGRR